MNTRGIKLILTTAALLTLSGCITGGDRAPGDQAAHAERALLAGERAKYQEARKLWRSFDLGFYFFNANYDCMCYPSGNVQVRVRNNRVIAAGLLDCELGVPVEDLQELHTIDGLFDLINNHLGMPDYRVKVSYHYGLGYPTDISFIHKDETLMDADIHIVVSEILIPVAAKQERGGK